MIREQCSIDSGWVCSFAWFPVTYEVTDSVKSAIKKKIEPYAETDISIRTLFIWGERYAWRPVKPHLYASFYVIEIKRENNKPNCFAAVDRYYY